MLLRLQSSTCHHLNRGYVQFQAYFYHLRNLKETADDGVGWIGVAVAAAVGADAEHWTVESE